MSPEFKQQWWEEGRHDLASISNSLKSIDESLKKLVEYSKPKDKKHNRATCSYKRMKIGKHWDVVCEHGAVIDSCYKNGECTYGYRHEN